jgi:hypothetical protein
MASAALPRPADIDLGITPLQAFCASFLLCLSSFFMLRGGRWPDAVVTLVPSTAHAVVVTALAARTWADYWDLLLAGHTDVFLAIREYDLTIGAITAGYMCSDTILCALSDAAAARAAKAAPPGTPAPRPLFTADMLAHHVVALWTTISCCLTQRGAAMQAMFIASEASTPFVNLNTVLPPDSPWRIPNGVALFLTFGAVRIGLLYGPILRALWLTAVPEVMYANPVVYFTQIAALVPLYALNAFWFVKIVAKLARRIKEAAGGGRDSGAGKGGAGRGSGKDAGGSKPVTPAEGDPVAPDATPVAEGGARRRVRV